MKKLIFTTLLSFLTINLFAQTSNVLWAKQMGGAYGEGGTSIVADPNGNVYTTGTFQGTADFDPGQGIYNLTSVGARDIFVVKLGQKPTYTYSYNNGLGFGKDINNNTWNIWSANGSNIWDWHSNYVGGYLHYTFKVLNYSGYYCSGSCRYHNIWSKNPNLGFEITDVLAHDSGIFPESAQNNHKYQIDIQWKATGYHASVYDITAGAQYSDKDYNHSVNLNTYDSWTWGYSLWDMFTGAYSDENVNAHAAQWTANVYQYEPTGTTGGGGDIRTDALPVMQFRRFIPPQNAIKPNGKQLIIADPIQLGTGTYFYKHNDINIPSINGTLNFTRFYNSLNGNVAGPLGNGWSHTYNYYLENKQDTAWDIHYPDGHVSTFIPMNSSGQSFPIFSGTLDSLQKNNNKSYSLFTKEKQQYHFDSTGKLDSIIDLNNNITRLYYTGSKLDSIAAPGGRSLLITYSGNKITSVKDPLNRVYNYGYDANNNLIKVKDANNGTASFTYDGAHSMLTALNPLNNIIVNNTYSTGNKVITQKDAYNQATSIVYDFPNPGDATVTNPDNSQIVAHHDNYIRKTSEKDELGFTKTFAYDINSNENKFTNENNQSETRLFDKYGNLLSDTLPGGKITQAAYNYFNAPVQLTDAKGNQKTFYYNSTNNNLDSIRYPDNSLQVFSYNSNGQVIQSVDGNGNATTYTYSAAGDLLSTKTFAGIKQFAYDAAGRKVSETDENGHTTNYVYDNNNNIIKITDALGRTILNTYDANNQLLSVKDKKGFTTTYTYDKKGRKTSSANPKGGVTTYAYDVRDNLLSVTDPNNKVVSYTYDKKNRKTSVANALGTTQYQYDGAGNLIKVIDPTNKTTDYAYTATNKKQTEKDGLGNTSTFNYDNNDNLVSATDPLKRVTAYGYDVMNRLVSVKDAAKKTTSVTYDKNGNKKTVIDPIGHTQTYTYDAANRMINYQDAAGNNYTYSYDSAGNNKMLTKPTGTITKVFDAANRITTINNSTGNNYLFVYDNNDNVVTMSNSTGASNMIYDSLNLLTQYQDPYNKTVAFTFDAAGNKTSIIYPGSKTVSYAYDNANNLKTVTDWLTHTFTYTYDAAGRPTQLLYPNAARCNYGFDNAGRLTSKLNSFSNNTIISGSTFTLDAIGNRIAEQRQGQVPPAFPSLSRAYTYGNDDKMLSDSIWNFVNDNSGNRTSETNGVKTASYTFSVDNLLNNSVDTAAINTNYSYDPVGRRISKVVGANTDKYVLDISSSLSQILQITDVGGVVKSNYVYGLGLLESIDAANIPLYYHFDAQHNTAALTDQSGVIKDTYTYDPFGTMLSHTGTATQPFTFLGEYGVEQESSALFYARARYYDAANGRFISKDAFDYDLNNPQKINRYVYGTNNPLSMFDYTGLYGQQDNSSGFSSDISNLSDFFNKSGINGINNFWKKYTDNWYFPILKFGASISGDIFQSVGEVFGNGNIETFGSTLQGVSKGLGVIGKISTGIKVINDINTYNNNKAPAAETALKVAIDLYPTIASTIGTATFGKVGGFLAGYTATGSIKAGELLVNHTILGNILTDYLAAKYFKY